MVKTNTATTVEDIPKPRWALVSTLTGAHMIHDMSLGTLGVFLPFLREKLGFSLFLAGLLTPAQQAGSLLQPITGYLADRFGKRGFVVGFLTLTSLVMSLIGLSPAYVTLITIVAIGGLSSAAYHPAGSSLVTSFATGKWGTGLAIYHFGGNIGLAIGPLGAAWIVSQFGVEGSWLLMIPGVLWAVVVAGLVKEPSDSNGPVLPGKDAIRWVGKHKRAFISLGVIVLGRAVGAGGLALFLPTLLLERAYSLGMIAALTSGFFAIGGLGGLAAGWLSDRIGRHRVIALMLFIGPVSLMGFLVLDGLLAIFLLFLASISLRSEQPVIMALIQEWAPERRGTVVGIVLGSQFVLAGLGTSGIGWLADMVGLNNAFRIVALTPLIAIPFVRRLPIGQLEPQDPDSLA